MKIVIAASHRFHLLDLARELSALGHDVTFYSYVPTKRCEAFGLQRKNCRSLFLLLAPFIALERVTKKWWFTALKQQVLDVYMSMFMPKCDVYIALGTVYVKSLRLAKNRYKALTVLEWGSKHVVEQQEILQRVMGVLPQNQFFTERSIEGYGAADFIALPADHAKASFVARGISPERLLVNPYGVDLRMFHSTALSEIKQYDLITVGAWSLQKGSDLLAEVCKSGRFTLLHVGPLVDVPFPLLPNMHHVDPVDQSELVEYYKQAKVFVHPSRQDGLAMVQSQAISCGLPVVCSVNSGGRDLAKLLDNEKWIVEIESLTPEGIGNSIETALELARTQVRGPRDYAGRALDGMTWKSYAKRYENNLINAKYSKYQIFTK